MSHQINLPKKEIDLVQALDLSQSVAWPRRNTFYVLCRIAFYYLQGIRRFRTVSMEEGRLLLGYENDSGELRFRLEDLRTRFKTEIGRFMRMDIGPSVDKTKWGIDALRKASISQVSIEHSLRYVDEEQLKSRFFQMWLMYGTVGIQHYRASAPDGTLKDSMEIVPPWELLPLPTYPETPEELKGVTRFRYVPVDWLRKKRGLKGEQGLKIPKSEDELISLLEARQVPYGAPPRGDDGPEGASSPMYMFRQGMRSYRWASAAPKQTTELYVPLTETWIYGEDGTCSRYIVKAGKKILDDVDYVEAGINCPCSLSVARYVPDCSFYSPSFVHGLMAVNNQAEKMLTQLFKNVQDLDNFGALFWPLNAGAGKKDWQKADGRPKVITYEPDYATGGKVQPFVQAPFNSGDAPGKVVNLAVQLQDRISNQGPMNQGGAPGRVDSAAGLGFLFEVQNIGVAASSHEVANAFSGAYKSVLYAAKAASSPTDHMELTAIDDNVAGVVIDKGGAVTLADNPIPNYWEVKIDIRDRQPKSKEQLKQELVSMLQMQIINPRQFRLENYKQDLGFPTANRAEWEQYRKAVFNNILMFRDGKMPGGNVFNPVHDNAEIFLMALIDFTSRIEFALADKPVREQFEEFKKFLETQLAGFPSQLPDPAMMAQMGMDAPPGQPTGGGGGPGPGSQGPMGPMGMGGGGPPGGQGGAPQGNGGGRMPSPLAL